MSRRLTEKIALIFTVTLISLEVWLDFGAAKLLRYLMKHNFELVALTKFKYLNVCIIVGMVIIMSVVVMYVCYLEEQEQAEDDEEDEE